MSPAALTSEQATHVRRQVVGLATVMSLLLYLDRFCISICTNYIRQDLGITDYYVSWLSSAFFFAYALGQVPSGWLIDRFGVRLMLSIYILLWSSFTGLQAYAHGFALLCLLQLGCGLAQAGAYPAGARLVRDWNPPTSRGIGNAMVALGGRIGAALAPILTAWMMVQFVPVAVSSLLSDSAYLNAPAFAARLLSTPTKESEAARLAYLRSFLISDEQILVADLAKSADGNQSASSEQVRELRALINRLINLPDLYQAKLFDGSLDKEGLQLSQRLAQTGELTIEQRTRLHRLLLESTFPKTLGNIYVSGWRPSMMVYGVIGVVIAALFWWGVRDDPQHDPRCNDAERALIQQGVADSIPATPLSKPPFPWRALLTDISLWGNCLLQFTTNVGWVFLVRTMPQYLEEVHEVPLLLRGWMTSVPIWVGVIGVFCGGRLADVLVQRLGLKWGRRAPVLISRFTAALGYALCIALSWLVPKESAPTWFPWVYVAALSLVALSTDIGVPAVWAFAQDVGGKYTASILGWGNMWGNLGATVATPLYASLLRNHTLADWNLLFCCLGGAYILGALGTLVMDPTRPLTVSPAEHAARS